MSFMLSVTYKPLMLSVFILSVLMLSVVMLSVIMLSVIMLSVVALLINDYRKKFWKYEQSSLIY